MSFPIPRRTIGQLLQQGYKEIPEIFATSIIALVGIGMATYGTMKYAKEDGDNRRYKATYVIMRPDDPRVAKIKKQ